MTETSKTKKTGRRTLNEAVSLDATTEKDFVNQTGTFKSQQPTDIEPEVAPTTTMQPQPNTESLSLDTPTKLDLILQTQLPPKEATVRITVDLAESMHRKLSMLSARTGRKKAEIVRTLLEDLLQDVHM